MVKLSKADEIAFKIQVRNYNDKKIAAIINEPLMIYRDCCLFAYIYVYFYVLGRTLFARFSERHGFVIANI